MLSKMDNKHQLKFYIKQTPDGKGAGMFAKEVIKRGDLVLSEAPVLKIKEGQRMETIRSLTPAHKQILESLSNCHISPEMSLECRYINILSTNTVTLKDDSEYQSGLFKDFSRVNHSCLPNVNHFWNSDLGMEELWCERDIQKDEEILTSYIELYADRESRQGELKMKWNFDCRCTVCSLTGNELLQSDKRRRRLKELDDNILEFARIGRTNVALRMVEDLMETLNQEIPYDASYTARASYDAFNLIYMTSRDKKQLKMWAKKWCESIMISQGGKASNMLADLVRSYARMK